MLKRRLAFLLVIGLLLAVEVIAQPAMTPLDDIAFVIDDTEDEEAVQQAIADFQQSTGVALKVSTLYQTDDMEATIQQRHAQWLKAYPEGISLLLILSLDNKIYLNTRMQVTPSLEKLLSEEERNLLVTGTMEPIFRNSPSPNDAFTRGLLTGIAALQKLLLKKQVEKEDPLPEDIVSITHIDEEFAAGIDDEQLRIDYQIKNEYLDNLKAAKLEVFKPLAKEPCFTTPLEIQEQGSFLWNGKLSGQRDDYIAYKDSPFTVKITVGKDEAFERVASTEAKASVEEFADEWRSNQEIAQWVVVNREGENREKLTKYQYYLMMREDIKNEIISGIVNPTVMEEYDNRPLTYMSANIINTKFLGRDIKVHKNYLSVLNKIEEAMGKPDSDYRRYKEDPIYSMSGFSIRYLNYKNEMSNHSFGMAIDVDAIYNPQRFTPTWMTIQIVTNYNLLFAMLSPEEMRKINNIYKSANLDEHQIDTIIAGLQAIDVHNDQYLYDINNLENIARDIETFYTSWKNIYDEVKKLHLRLLTLEENGNQEEIKRITQKLEIKIPSKIMQEKEWLLHVKNSVISLMALVDDGYEKAFKIKQRVPSDYNYIVSYLGNVKTNILCLDDMFDQVFSYAQVSTELPECYTKAFGTLKLEKSRLTYLTNITESMYTYNQMAFNTGKYKGELREHRFNVFVNWLSKNKNDLINLSRNGFFRLDPKFVYYFLQNGRVDWGGNYNTAIDCMHFELKKKFQKF